MQPQILRRRRHHQLDYRSHAPRGNAVNDAPASSTGYHANSGNQKTVNVSAGLNARHFGYESNHHFVAIQYTRA